MTSRPGAVWRPAIGWGAGWAQGRRKRAATGRQWRGCGGAALLLSRPCRPWRGRAEPPGARAPGGPGPGPMRRRRRRALCGSPAPADASVISFLPPAESRRISRSSSSSSSASYSTASTGEQHSEGRASTGEKGRGSRPSLQNRPTLAIQSPRAPMLPTLAIGLAAAGLAAAQGATSSPPGCSTDYGGSFELTVALTGQNGGNVEVRTRRESRESRESPQRED